jgi:hypothetical protein
MPRHSCCSAGTTPVLMKKVSAALDLPRHNCMLPLLLQPEWPAFLSGASATTWCHAGTPVQTT